MGEITQLGLFLMYRSSWFEVCAFAIVFQFMVLLGKNIVFFADRKSIV